MSAFLLHKKAIYCFLLLALSIIFMVPDTAYAACAGPAGTEGIIIYNQDNHVMQYCDGADWVAMGKAGSGAGAGPCHGTTTATPDAPVERGNYTHATELNDTKGIAYASGLAYVTSETSDSLTIIDVCDPDAPVRRGYLQDATNLNGAYAIEVYGNYAFLTTWASGLGNGLTVIDISDPDNPVYKTNLTTATLKGTVDIEIDSAGTYAYVTSAASHRLMIVDISDPLNPVELSNIQGASAGHDSVTVNGNYAYVGFTPPPGPNKKGIQIFNVTNKSAPSALGSDLTSFSGPEFIAIDSTGSYLYVADNGANNVKVVDVTNKNAPAVIKTVSDASLSGAYSIAMAPDNDNFVYVASLTADAITIIDVSDPVNAYARGNVTNAATLNGANAITVNGNFSYVASRTADSMTVIEISTASGGSGSCTNPADPEGTILYNSSNHVMQFCNGDEWAAMGPVPGSGGAGCTNPAQPESVMVFNNDYSVMQYCDGVNWVAIGK